MVLVELAKEDAAVVAIHSPRAEEPEPTAVAAAAPGAEGAAAARGAGSSGSSGAGGGRGCGEDGCACEEGGSQEGTGKERREEVSFSSALCHEGRRLTALVF